MMTQLRTTALVLTAILCCSAAFAEITETQALQAKADAEAAWADAVNAREDAMTAETYLGIAVWMLDDRMDVYPTMDVLTYAEGIAVFGHRNDAGQGELDYSYRWGQSDDYMSAAATHWDNGENALSVDGWEDAYNQFITAKWCYIDAKTWANSAKGAAIDGEAAAQAGIEVFDPYM